MGTIFSPVVSLVVWLTVPLVAQAQPAVETLDTTDDTVSRGHYIAGGILGTALGFGVGHAINGQYTTTGWIFTVGEGAALGAVVGALASGDDYQEGGQKKVKLTTAAQVTAVAGGLALIGLRIWEIIDVWTRPQLRERPLPRRQARVMVFPTVVGQHAGVGLGGHF